MLPSPASTIRSLTVAGSRSTLLMLEAREVEVEVDTLEVEATVAEATLAVVDTVVVDTVVVDTTRAAKVDTVVVDTTRVEVTAAVTNFLARDYSLVL